jgi:hypothetical protein
MLKKKKYIHVNQLVIRHNKSFGNTLPACRVQYGLSGPSKYCHEVIINGPSKLVSRPNKPLACGAKVWVESYSPVKLVGQTPYSVLREAMKKIKKSKPATRQSCRINTKKAA